MARQLRAAKRELGATHASCQDKWSRSANRHIGRRILNGANALPMSDPLRTYLHDHLAAARMAIDLLEALSDRHRGEALGTLTAELLLQVREDRDTLIRLAERTGMRRGNRLKEVAARIAERATRTKLRSGGSDGVRALQALETLALGVWGKRALWLALATVVPEAPELREFDFGRLVERAESQHARLEAHRLGIAQGALAGSQ